MPKQTRAKDQSFELLQEKLREIMNDVADSISTGSCENIEDYRHQTGIIHGLALAERELLDLDDKLYKDA